MFSEFKRTSPVVYIAAQSAKIPRSSLDKLSPNILKIPALDSSVCDLCTNVHLILETFSTL